LPPGIKLLSPLTPHDEWEAIRDAFKDIQKHIPQRHRCDVYRVVEIPFSAPEIALNGRGALVGGGRYNPRKASDFPVIVADKDAELLRAGFSTTYVAEDEDTAHVEAFSHFSRLHEAFEIPERFELYLKQNKIVTAILDCESLIDFTNPDVLRAIRYNTGDVDVEWRLTQERGEESLSQAIGRAAFATHIEAIRYRSVRHTDGINVAVFPDNDFSKVERAGEVVSLRFTNITTKEIRTDIRIPGWV
jgi:RES domain-containing protein